MRKILVGYKGWHKQPHLLDKMSFKDLLYAYFSYPSIQISIGLAGVFLAIGLYIHESTGLVLLIIVLSPFVYSLVEYVLHRYVLHGRFLYRSKATAPIWKRVHYDHHIDPSNLAVLFGDLRTTLPPIILIAAPLGYLFHGMAGSAIAVSCGIVLTSLYELCHASQHLPFQPKNPYLRRLKARHLTHHFHNETGNFGITTRFWDLRLNTNYEGTGDRPRSPTVRNLGYVGEETRRYPWVKELSDDVPAAGD